MRTLLDLDHIDPTLVRELDRRRRAQQVLQMELRRRAAAAMRDQPYTVPPPDAPEEAP